MFITADQGHARLSLRLLHRMVGGPRLHPSAVELRCRLRVKSRTPDCAYRTARPILRKRGPGPVSRDLASHDDETPGSFATCAGVSRGSILLGFAGGR